MTLTKAQIDQFKLAVGHWNGNPYGTDRASFIDAGDDVIGDVVTTHETLEDHIAARGRKSDEDVSVGGNTLYVWTGVQFAKGTPRVRVLYMPFNGIAAAAII